LNHELFFKERGTTFKEEENFLKLERQKPLERKMRNPSDLVMRKKGECEKFKEICIRVDLCLPCSCSCSVSRFCQAKWVMVVVTIVNPTENEI
jgi:hypothetical protein